MDLRGTWLLTATVALLTWLPDLALAQQDNVCWMPVDSFSAPALSARLEQRVTLLLEAYGRRMQPPRTNPRDVEAALTLDRRAVFHAGVRAMFTPFSRSAVSENNGANVTRLIDFVEAITGIWGGRPGDTEGRRQFRLSVQLQQDLEDQLRGSSCFSRDPESERYGHVILPGMRDDAQLDSDPVIVTQNIISYRALVQVCGTIIDFRMQPCSGVAASPLLVQVSFRGDRPAEGEFDIDFDEGRTHTTPSNSDPLALGRDRGRDRWHLDVLNEHYPLTPRLHFDCHDRYNHGRDSYDGERNCIR